MGVNNHVGLVFTQQNDKLFGTVLSHSRWRLTHHIRTIYHQAIRIWIRKRFHAHAGVIISVFLNQIGLLIPLWHPASCCMSSHQSEGIAVRFGCLDKDRLCILIEGSLLVALASDNFVDFELIFIQIWRADLLVNYGFFKWPRLALSVSKRAW